MNTDYIESLVVRLCKQPRTFEFISKNVNGLDPVFLSTVLTRLENSKILRKVDDLWSIREKGNGHSLDLTSEETQLYLKKYMGYFDFLETPHPLDFEWRNSSSSLNFLINEVQSLNSVNDKILFLGMPTLFATAYLKDIPQKVTLVERNEPIVEGLLKLGIDKKRFDIIKQDIFKANPKDIGKYHCIIMDPPWYSPHFYQFMWLASRCVEHGGIIGISLPPINTRPNIDKERIRWFSFCQKNGLCLENLFAQKLHYAMPFFEFNAFRAAGIKDILPFWRKGDLAYFRKIRSSKAKRPDHLDLDEWIERDMDSIRIRIKIDRTTDSKIEIKNIVKGDILPTVSTRDSRRANANIWTSGNRLFEVNNPKRFIDIIDDTSSLKAYVEEREYVRSFLDTVVDLEKKELNNYLDWLYHEMERQTD